MNQAERRALLHEPQYSAFFDYVKYNSIPLSFIHWLLTEQDNISIRILQYSKADPK